MSKARDDTKTKTPKAMDLHVGARIRSRRLMLDVSQTKLGEALGLTFQQIQKYEKGMNRVGASRLAQIADTLKVPVAWFFGGEGAPGRLRATAQKTRLIISLRLPKVWRSFVLSARSEISLCVALWST
jgi:transcriptional regulator with XRE-family HTH domain